MAAASYKNIYNLTLDDEGRLVCDLTKLQIHMVQELNYSQTDAERLVSEISKLLITANNAVLHHAAWRRNSELVKVMLRSVNPSNTLTFIQKQAGGVWGLFPIVCQRRDSFKLFLESLTGDERCQLLQMRNRYGQTILHFAAAETDAETEGMILNSVSEVNVTRF